MQAIFKKEGVRLEGAGRPSQKIMVLDLNTNKSRIYNSIHATSRALNVRASTIYNALKQQKPYKGKFVLKRLD